MAESRGKGGRKPRSSGRPEAGPGGILQGLTDLIEKLGELADKGTELSRTGQLGDEKGINGVYGFSVKVGRGGRGLKVEPFGNIAKDKVTGRRVVQEVREPMVDVFEESDHTLVVAEMPGIDTADVQIEVRDDILTLSAARGDLKYRKEVLLSRAYSLDRIRVSASNGIVRIKCLD